MGLPVAMSSGGFAEGSGEGPVQCREVRGAGVQCPGSPRDALQATNRTRNYAVGTTLQAADWLGRGALVIVASLIASPNKHPATSSHASSKRSERVQFVQLPRCLQPIILRQARGTKAQTTVQAVGLHPSNFPSFLLPSCSRTADAR